MVVLIHTPVLLWEQEVGIFSDALVETVGKWFVGGYLCDSFLASRSYGHHFLLLGPSGGKFFMLSIAEENQQHSSLQFLQGPRLSGRDTHMTLGCYRGQELLVPRVCCSPP